jgi:hypothetical protein
MTEASTTTSETYLSERMTRFADFLDTLTIKDENLKEWASWVRTITPAVAVASIRAGALGDDLKQAASCVTAQTRAYWCARALEGFAVQYGFELANFSQPETERVCRYLELLAHSAQ